MPSENEIIESLQQVADEMKHAIANLDLRTVAADYTAMLIIRDKIVATGLFTHAESGELAASIPIDISTVIKPHHITDVATLFGDAVILNIRAMSEDGFTFEAIKARLCRVSFEINE